MTLTILLFLAFVNFNGLPIQVASTLPSSRTIHHVQDGHDVRYTVFGTVEACGTRCPVVASCVVRNVQNGHSVRCAGVTIAPTRTDRLQPRSGLIAASGSSSGEIAAESRGLRVKGFGSRASESAVCAIRTRASSDSHKHHPSSRLRVPSRFRQSVATCLSFSFAFQDPSVWVDHVLPRLALRPP
eukprot:1862170-Rhodomonas_salina.1